MDYIDKKNFDDIEEFEKSIKNIYLKLANLEYEGKANTQEYNDIFSLLETAKRLEKSKFDKIELNEDMFQKMHNYLTRNQGQTNITQLLKTQEYIESIRLNNIIGELLMQYDAFITEDELNDPNYGEELEDELNERQFLDTYGNNISRNIIYTANADISKMPDDELRKYFIYLKYFLIFVNPSYERDFIAYHGVITPPIHLNSSIHKVSDYTEEEFDCCNRNSLTIEIVDDIEYILNGDDEDFEYGENRLDLYRILSANKARLISMQDHSFIDLIKKTIDKIIEDDSDYQTKEKEGVREKIDTMFKESHELLTVLMERKKLELK